jgi:hypothetical protein
MFLRNVGKHLQFEAAWYAWKVWKLWDIHKTTATNTSYGNLDGWLKRLRQATGSTETSINNQAAQRHIQGDNKHQSNKLPPCDKWVPVTTAWRGLRLRMEERPPILRVALNILNTQSRTAEKGWSSSLWVGRGANNSSPRKRIFVTKYSQTKPRTWTYSKLVKYSRAPVSTD